VLGFNGSAGSTVLGFDIMVQLTWIGYSAERARLPPDPTNPPQKASEETARASIVGHALLLMPREILVA